MSGEEANLKRNLFMANDICIIDNVGVIRQEQVIISISNVVFFLYVQLQNPHVTHINL